MPHQYTIKFEPDNVQLNTDNIHNVLMDYINKKYNNPTSYQMGSLHTTVNVSMWHQVMNKIIYVQGKPKSENTVTLISRFNTISNILEQLEFKIQVIIGDKTINLGQELRDYAEHLLRTNKITQVHLQKLSGVQQSVISQMKKNSKKSIKSVSINSLLKIISHFKGDVFLTMTKS